jgi:hypothetical protein
MTDIARYHSFNPDPQNPHCCNTGDSGDGVLFPGVQSLSGRPIFIGRQSIIEAFAELHDMTPARVKKLIAGTDKASIQVNEANLKAEQFERKATRFDALVEALEMQGFSLPDEG